MSTVADRAALASSPAVEDVIERRVKLLVSEILEGQANAKIRCP